MNDQTKKPAEAASRTATGEPARRPKSNRVTLIVLSALAAVALGFAPPKLGQMVLCLFFDGHGMS